MPWPPTHARPSSRPSWRCRPTSFASASRPPSRSACWSASPSDRLGGERGGGRRPALLQCRKVADPTPSRSTAIMKITDVTVQRFRYQSQSVRDADGHGHASREKHDAVMSLLTISTDEGLEGHYFGAPNEEVIRSVVKPVLVGQDPLYRERLWYVLKERQRLHLATLADRVLTAVDLALWDLGGKIAGLPVHKLIGASRDKVPAYASTMVGDDTPGGLDTPEAYARYAIECKERGYPAFKLHTWQPPTAGAPSVKNDIKACAAVREAMGPDYPLMLDPF